MNSKSLIAALIYIFSAASTLPSVWAQELTLVEKGRSGYQIILPKNATVQEIQAAKVLLDYLHRISGANIPVKHDEGQASSLEILVGQVNRLEMKSVSLEALGPDGHYIGTRGKKLVILGGPEKGVIYGVYAFLENYLGCKKFTSKVDYIARKSTIHLETIDELEVPVFSYREVFYNDVYDSEFMDWHRLHSFGGRGSAPSAWGFWVHTFHQLLNPKEYGESHPEYFSYYEGKRHAGLVPSWDGKSVQPEAQLCLTNPEVLEIVSENLQKAIDQNPEAKYWSVSQNDNVNYCRCEHCAALGAQHAAFAPEEKMYKTHGSEYPALGMGSMLTFVNKMAERFPDKVISTLAYQHTRVPPQDLVPAKNVNIMLCSIESTRNEPLETGDLAFSEDLRDGKS